MEDFQAPGQRRRWIAREGHRWEDKLVVGFWLEIGKQNKEES